VKPVLLTDGTAAIARGAYRVSNRLSVRFSRIRDDAAPRHRLVLTDLAGRKAGAILTGPREVAGGLTAKEERRLRAL